MNAAAAPLSALVALRVVQAALAAAGAGARAGAWLRALDCFHACPADAAVIFRTDALGQRLVPIAAQGVNAAKVPSVSMSDLNHPLVYSLVRGEDCLLDAGRLEAGEGQQLLSSMRHAQALLALRFAAPNAACRTTCCCSAARRPRCDRCEPTTPGR